MSQDYLTSIVIVLGLAVAVSVIGQRLRLPKIVSFLLTGVLVGPHVLKLIGSYEQVEFLAEIGVVALLFTIGLEFSLRRLWEMRGTLLYGGIAQVSLTGLFAALWAWRMSLPAPAAVFAGFLVALSSTAVVLSTLEARGELQTPHGRTTLAILLFQDVMVVPMMLVIPFLSQQEAVNIKEIGILLGKIALVGAIVFMAARRAVPFILHRVAQSQDRQLMLLSVVFLGLGIAWLTSSLGLSLALGAFLAGLIVAESDYHHTALSHALPLRDVFTSFFFIAVGMLLDVPAVIREPVLIFLMVLGLMLLKIVAVMLAIMLLRLSIRTVLLTAMALCQVGEFSFVLYQAGLEAGLVSGALETYFLPVAVVTLLLTPFVIEIAPRVAEAAQRLPLPASLKGLMPEPSGEIVGLSNHLVIIGFGFNGRNLARVARAAGIPYAIVEMNPDTVREQRKRGEPIHYGDATHEATLHHVGVPQAGTVVVAISDPIATRRVTQLVKQLNPRCHLIVRTRFVADIEDLHRLGADEVIPEEFETAIEIFTRVLFRYLVPPSQIKRFVEQVRAGQYQALRTDAPVPRAPLEALLEHIAAHPELTVAEIRLCPASAFVGQDLAHAGLRQKYGITVLGIIRGGKGMPNPAAETVLHAGDTLIVMGPEKALQELAEVCELPPPTMSPI